MHICGRAHVKQAIGLRGQYDISAALAQLSQLHGVHQEDLARSRVLLLHAPRPVDYLYLDAARYRKLHPSLLDVEVHAMAQVKRDDIRISLGECLLKQALVIVRPHRDQIIRVEELC